MTSNRAQSKAAPATKGDEAPAEIARPPLTKIVATIGPASSQRDIVAKLIGAGVSIFRLNFSHGSMEDHALRAQMIRETASEFGRPIAVLGDLQGPKIRVGKVSEDGIDVASGATIEFARGDFVARGNRLACTYPNLIDDVKVGQRLLVNDGAIRTLIVSKDSDAIECAVTVGGLITSNKGINLPDTDLSVAPLSERDWARVEWALAHDLDFLALSFVRMAADVALLRQGVEGLRTKRKFEAQVALIAKIELPRAVENIESIVQAADGIMVARGDLGVEMDIARVPVIQKQLVKLAQAYGKPCIVATQMLESMINAPSPTRAEVSDVANAIFDGADAVMLSGETAVGKYPALAVEMMRRVAGYSEAFLADQPSQPSPPAKLVESRYRTAALAHGVWTIAQDIEARFIVVWSQQGGGARYLSQNDFRIPILAITSDDRAARRMQLLRGVTPVRMPHPESLAHFTAMVDGYLLETGWAKMGDTCILVAGQPIGVQGVTNSLAIHNIGDPTSGFGKSK